MSNVVPIKVPLRLRCIECGATASAACDCRAAYMPARDRAREAIEKHPRMSNREIAKAIDVGARTVDRARAELYAPDGAVAKPVAQPRIALADDDLSPADADRTIRTIAQYLDGRLLKPPPGIRARLMQAMARASPGDVKAITEAADFLVALRGAAK